MNSSRVFTSEKNFQGVSLIVAPLLLGFSTFFWNNGEYSVPSATLIILSMFFWIPALTGLFALLKEKMPTYAVYGLWIAVLGCISGVCFAFLGYLTTIFNISHEAYIKQLAEYPLTSQLLLFATGPLFPLSLMLLGINLIRTGSALLIGLLIFLGGVAFPASRILREPLLAHLSDILLLVPCIMVSFRLVTAPNIKSFLL